MKLSIITINYNNLEGLKRTYESVVSQTCQDFEWIIIDGGSTDGSKEFIEEHQERFAYWCSEPDKGIYNALNKGIKICSGEYISCMNSGDSFYEKDTLQFLCSYKGTSDILYGDSLRLFKDGHTEVDHFPDPVELYTFSYGNICHQAMFVRTVILKEKGFDESYKIAADYCRWVEALFNGYTFEYINMFVCKFEMGGLSSANIELSELEYERARKEIFPEAVRLSFDRINKYKEIYEKDYLLQEYLKPLEQKSKISRWFTTMVLKILKRIFINKRIGL